MNDKILKIAMLCFISLLMIACNKDIDEEMLDVPDGPVPVVEQVEMDLLVMIDKEVANIATCWINGQAYNFNSRGHICIESVLMSLKGEFVVVKAPGYVDNVKLVIPNLDGHQVVNMSLAKLSEKDVFESSNGYTFSDNNLKINVPNNAFVQADGELYEGEIKLMIKIRRVIYVSQSLESPVVYMANENTMVSNSAWVDIHFLADNGDELELLNGEVIQLEIKRIFSSTEVLEVNMYHFNGENWTEKGEVEMKEDWFIGEITNLGLNVIGRDYKSTLIETKVLDASGAPIINSPIMFLIRRNHNPYMGFTDNDGIVRMPVSRDTTVFLGVISDCLIQEIHRPYEYKQIDNLPWQDEIQVIDNWNAMYYKSNMIKGKLLDCDSLPVANSFFLANGIPHYTDTKGEFTVYKKSCRSSLGINVLTCEGEDRYNHVFTDLIEDEDIDLGDILICP